MLYKIGENTQLKMKSERTVYTCELSPEKKSISEVMWRWDTEPLLASFLVRDLVDFIWNACNAEPPSLGD